MLKKTAEEHITGGKNILNPILWVIDSGLDSKIFERLCHDLMYRNGYKEIMPLGGTYDGGRDAQLCSFHAKDAKGGDVFFQYSLEKKWERKLERELKKVHNKGHKISKFIFITSQNVTGTKMD